jgi:hypothetical protein
MARDRRADILVAMPERKVLCELKRDYHSDVWTAAEQQLDRFYLRDPEARGFGVYVVFWFGDKRPRPNPAPPGARRAPDCAADMANMLRERLPRERAARIAIVVIDVSGEVPKIAPAKRNVRTRKPARAEKQISRAKSRRRARKTKPATRSRRVKRNRKSSQQNPRRRSKPKRLR